MNIGDKQICYEIFVICSTCTFCFLYSIWLAILYLLEPTTLFNFPGCKETGVLFLMVRNEELMDLFFNKITTNKNMQNNS